MATVAFRVVFRVALGVAAILVGAGCASMAMLHRDVDALIARGDYDEAARVVSGSRSLYGERDALLFDLERAMLLHIAGRYDASNQAFEAAKRTARDYLPSVTQHAASWVVNDRLLDYHGAWFERSMIHVFSALNYTQLGHSESALVEARQLDHLLRGASDTGEHREDAFGRYLSGMLYEERGELDDAYVAYWKALEAYARAAETYGMTPPRALGEDGLRAAGVTGRGRGREFRNAWQRLVPYKAWQRRPSVDWSRAGEIVVLHYNGLAPRKVERRFDLSFGRGWAYVDADTTSGIPEDDLETAVAAAAAVPARDTIRFALPAYRPQRYAIRDVDVGIEGAHRVGPSDLVHDVGAIAERDLAARMDWIRARAITRSAVKYAIARSVLDAAREAEGPAEQRALIAAAAALRAWTVLSERADIRSWRAVPDEIRMVKSLVPEGHHAVDLDFRDGAGNVVERQTAWVRVRPRERTFLIVRTVQ